MPWVCAVLLCVVLALPAQGVMPGVLTLDHDLDLGDWANFVAVFTGPAGGVLMPGAAYLDFDADGDVDLVDATIFAVVVDPALPSSPPSTSGPPAAFELRVTSGGLATITVCPGVTVDYAVVGEIVSGDSEGLAFFGFDLEFDGGALSPALAPTASPMTEFAVPDGVSNPAGFGGTPESGRLLQVGGGQNVIANTVDNAAFPVGTVVPGVAVQGSPQTLVTGSLLAPTTPGTYHLTTANVFGSVLSPGATGGPAWPTDMLQPGTSAMLTVTVDPTAVPATSTWGLVTMLLVGLTAGSIAFGQRHTSGIA